MCWLMLAKKRCTLGEYFQPFREAFAEPVIGVDCVGESSKQELPIVTFVEGRMNFMNVWHVGSNEDGSKKKI